MLFICLNSTFCAVVQNLVFKIEVRLYHSCELDPGQNLDSIAVSVFVFIFLSLTNTETAVVQGSIISKNQVFYKC